jgi:hypothetical protein
MSVARHGDTQPGALLEPRFESPPRRRRRRRRVGLIRGLLEQQARQFAQDVAFGEDESHPSKQIVPLPMAGLCAANGLTRGPVNVELRERAPVVFHEIVHAAVHRPCLLTLPDRRDRGVRQLRFQEIEIVQRRVKVVPLPGVRLLIGQLGELAHVRGVRLCRPQRLLREVLRKSGVRGRPVRAGQKRRLGGFAELTVEVAQHGRAVRAALGQVRLEIEIEP